MECPPKVYRKIDSSFNRLGTVVFQQKLRPAAIKIYSLVFPGVRVQDLRENGNSVHILDKEFGIDSLLFLPSGQWISIQEKYRKNYALKYMDFTQEYMNGVGTSREAEGEWFKLGSQLYFYGWANKDENDFERWYILNVARYKVFVERAGGLSKIGKYRQNNEHGRASFYAIPMEKLLDSGCVMTHYLRVRKIDADKIETKEIQQARPKVLGYRQDSFI